MKIEADALAKDFHRNVTKLAVCMQTKMVEQTRHEVQLAAALAEQRTVLQVQLNERLQEQAAAQAAEQTRVAQLAEAARVEQDAKRARREQLRRERAALDEELLSLDDDATPAP